MHVPTTLAVFILAILDSQAYAARKTQERVLLSNVKSLTLRKDLKTSHNRVSAIPQLRCIGGTAKGLYDIDVMRCKNAGSSYDDSDVEWTCTASVPEEFKLGTTDVICEGFSSPDDAYVLKGSCGVEYRLALTELGEGKYGRKEDDFWQSVQRTKSGNFASLIFWAVFIGIVAWMVYAAFFRGDARPRGDRPGWGGGGGRGDDPPPPYDYHPSPKPKASTSSRRARAVPVQGQEAWRPGFWTGALGGAAAGFLTGTRRQNGQQSVSDQSLWGNGNQGHGNGEGSSRWGGSGRASSSVTSGPSYGTSRHESSGFGGTSRR